MIFLNANQQYFQKGRIVDEAFRKTQAKLLLKPEFLLENLIKIGEIFVSPSVSSY